MKYKVGVSEKVTKDGKDYHVWKVSDEAGFYLADGIEGEEAQEQIEKIIASACALAVKLETQAEAVGQEQSEQKQTTAQQPREQEPKKQDTKKQEHVQQEPPKQEQKTQEERLPYMVRRSTGEKIVIDKDIFKLGKDAACVDYVVDNNPTISRNHADIERKEDGFYARDKGSLNHTFVDGKKIAPKEAVKLTSGSLLQLSDEVFEFVNVAEKKRKKR